MKFILMKNYIITLQFNHHSTKRTFTSILTAFLYHVRAGFCWTVKSFGSQPKTAHLNHWNKSPEVVPWVLGKGRSLGNSDEDRVVDGWARPGCVPENCSKWRCNMWTSIVMENDHMIEHLWTCLSKLRPQNFAKVVYVYMLVNCTTIWHHVCGNYSGIIVSHCHLRSLAIESLQPQWIFSLPNLCLRFQFGLEVPHPDSLQKHNFFLFVTSQMFLTQFHMTLFLSGKQHVWHPAHRNLFLYRIFC